MTITPATSPHPVQRLHPLGEQGIELGEDLSDGLDPGAPAECHDDVAELALERAAARELEAAEQVLPHFNQVEPGVSIRVTVWPAGVRAASKGRQATGMLDRLPKNGMACSMPQ